jgi:glutamine amidotransferase
MMVSTGAHASPLASDARFGAAAMCRLFAMRAARPASADGPLVAAPHSLLKQSCCDRRGECHESGWGIGWYEDGSPRRVRSERPARGDPRFAATAREVVSTTVLGHVRQASVGGVAERNSHPFVVGRWLFIHNGTLRGFDADRGPLLDHIPAHLRGRIEGETDSEHAFAFLLGRLERAFGSLDAPGAPRQVGDILRDAVRELAALYPGTAEEPSRLNFVLTDGATLAASRWVHTLYLRADVGSVMLASEAVDDGPWREVPDRSLVLIHPDPHLYTIEPISEGGSDGRRRDHAGQT